MSQKLFHHIKNLTPIFGPVVNAHFTGVNYFQVTQIVEDKPADVMDVVVFNAEELEKRSMLEQISIQFFQFIICEI